MLNKAFNLCTPVTNSTGVTAIETWLNNAYSYSAMLNYPYETSFLKPLPPWPANVTCQQMSSVNTSSNDYNLFDAIRAGSEVYYNYKKTLTCNEVYGDTSSDSDMSGWNILACEDMAMPMESNGVTDMFPKIDWNEQAYTSFCNATYGVTPG